MSQRGHSHHDDLPTPGEWRVVNAVRHGMGNAEVAHRRNVSLDAVKFYLGNILGRLRFCWVGRRHGIGWVCPRVATQKRGSE